MTPDAADRISSAIDLANELVAQRSEVAAASAFATARAMVIELQDPAAVSRRVSGHVKALGNEREHYRNLVAGRRASGRPLLILADSLGLPRPDDKQGRLDGAERTYPALFLDELPTHRVDSYCQRYFTSRDVLDLVVADHNLGRDSDVLVHVGLNDTAARIFLEPTRLALDLLPADVKDKVVAFGQRNRRLILRHLPEEHYVDPTQFRANLDALLETLARRNVGKVVLSTVILPPVRFWPATPGLQRNFGQYNQMIMDAAARHGGRLFDVDRHMWARQHEGVLLDDGMHLSFAGHRLFAAEAAALLR